MTTSPWIAALIALFAWWLSTGTILLVVRLADRLGLRARIGATLLGLPMLIGGALAFAFALPFLTTGTVYLGFFGALAIWGWIELAFLTGMITGPNLTPLPESTPEGERFLRAWGTVAYHEVLLTAGLVTVIALSTMSPNKVGMWTYVILYAARISAKLNLYFGVPKINVEFIPGALAHLPSHMRVGRVNWLFPFSVTGLSFAIALSATALMHSESAVEIVGYALLTTLAALALLEHWLMVLPLPDEKLWRWMLPARKHQDIQDRMEDAHGL